MDYHTRHNIIMFKFAKLVLCVLFGRLHM